MRGLALQAVVDDVYLGYISIPELLALLGEALTASGSGSGAAVAAAMAVYRSLVAGMRQFCESLQHSNFSLQTLNRSVC